MLWFAINICTTNQTPINNSCAISAYNTNNSCAINGCNTNNSCANSACNTNNSCATNNTLVWKEKPVPIVEQHTDSNNEKSEKRMLKRNGDDTQGNSTC